MLSPQFFRVSDLSFDELGVAGNLSDWFCHIEQELGSVFGWRNPSQYEGMGLFSFGIPATEPTPPSVLNHDYKSLFSIHRPTPFNIQNRLHQDLRVVRTSRVSIVQLV